MNNLFSTYTKGENRVTSSILSVLQFLSLHRTERLLGALMEESEFQLVQFQCQPSSGGQGAPDALISSSCRLFVEAKTKRNAVNKDQLKRHLKRLKGKETTQRLLVLTPDESCPDVIAKVKDNRVVWASFASLDQAIEELLGDRKEIISEREAFILRQLQIMLIKEKLVPSTDNVVVVPAMNTTSFEPMCANQIGSSGQLGI